MYVMTRITRHAIGSSFFALSANNENFYEKIIQFKNDIIENCGQIIKYNMTHIMITINNFLLDYF